MESSKFEITTVEIHKLVSETSCKWRQYWQQSIQLIKNQINGYLFSKLQNSNQKFPFIATDILTFEDDPNLKLLIINFSDIMNKLTPKIELSKIGSFNQSISMIERDFSIIVFKIILDVPVLIHYFPRSPNIIAFNDFPVNKQSSQDILLPNNKQFHWMLKTFCQNQYDISIQYIYNSIDLQITYINEDWYFLIPKQGTLQTTCFSEQIVKKFPNQNHLIQTIYNEVCQLLTLQSLSLETLDKNKIYTLNLKSQSISNFPLRKHMQSTNQEDVSYNQFKQQQLQFICVYSAPLFQSNQYKQSFNYPINDFKDENQLNSIENDTEYFRTLQLDDLKTRLSDFGLLKILIQIWNPDRTRTINSFQLTTQLFLFQELYSQYLQGNKKQDQLPLLKNLVSLYLSDLSENRKYQKLKYSVSKDFLSQINEEFDNQQTKFDQWLQTLLLELQKLKSAELKEILSNMQVQNFLGKQSNFNKTKIELINNIHKSFEMNNQFTIGLDYNYNEFIKNNLK